MADLRQFRQFVAVAEELSFRRAAERLHMAQPPLTTAIRRLEEEVGASLLERDNRIHRLTPAGRAFLDEARRTLAQAERTLAAARSAASGRRTLRLAFVDSTINILLPRILQAFRQQHGALDFQLQEDTTAGQLEALREDRIDAGLIVLPVDRQPGLYTHLLVDGDMRVALPEGHRLARHARLRLEQLAGEPWLLFPRHYGPGMHDLIVAACAAAGFVPEVVQEARQMQTIAGLVAGGIGVALVPSLLQPLRPPGVTFRPLQGRRARIPYRLALAYRTPSELIERFRETAQAAAPGLLLEGQEAAAERVEAIARRQTDQRGQPLPAENPRVQLPEFAVQHHAALVGALLDQHPVALRPFGLEAQGGHRLLGLEQRIAAQVPGEHQQQRRHGDEGQAAGAAQPAEEPGAFEEDAHRDQGGQQGQ